MILKVEGVEVGSKNRSKIDKKMESRWEDILGSVFNGFWWILGAKLGGKIEPRRAKTGQDTPRQGKRREGKGKEEEGQGMEGERCGKVWGGTRGTFCARGGGFTPPLGGDCTGNSPSRWGD